MTIDMETEFDERVNIYAEQHLVSKLNKLKGSLGREAYESGLERIQRSLIGMGHDEVFAYAREDLYVRVDFCKDKLDAELSLKSREEWMEMLDFYWGDLDRVEDLLGY